MISDMEGSRSFLNCGTEEAEPPGPGGSPQDLTCQSKGPNPLPQAADHGCLLRDSGTPPGQVSLGAEVR